MNGRIYDPELGRFLSADPYVQVPEYSQNFNRYSYVLNNPLTYADPSGHKISGLWKALVMVVVAIVVTVVTAGTGLAAMVAYGTAYAAAAAGVGAGLATGLGFAAGLAAAGAVVGAITGGISAALDGGNFGDVLRGMAVGAVQGALAGPLHMTRGLVNIVGHGIVGGLSNMAMGGRFQDGFLSAAAGAATAVSGLTDPGSSPMGILGRTMVASIAGGTASAIGGGKFANGAMTAAVQHLVNAEALDALAGYAEKNRWTPERQNQILKHYLNLGLEGTNASIDNLKYALFVDDQNFRLWQQGVISLEEYQRIQANQYQTLEVAQYASALMDPNYKAPPSGSVTISGGAAAFGGGIQGGVVFDSDAHFRFFGGAGVSTPGPLFSMTYSKGMSPDPGWTTSTSVSYGIVGGYEGGGNVGIGTPGASLMKNRYFKLPFTK